METGVVTIQEQVSTKTNNEEAPAGVILDHSSMKVDKVNLSTVLDDEITSHDCGNNTIRGEADVVNGSGNKETEESECKKGEAMKTISVAEDRKIVKEKASETEKDEQGSIFVHEPESFNKEIEDAKIILSDATLEKEKEYDITGKPEEVSTEKAVIEHDQTETKHSPEQEAEIGNISKVLIDTTPVKVDENDIEKSLNSAREEIPIKTDEVKEEKDSRTVETSVNGTEAEQKATVSVEEISKNGENIVNETVPEEETATDGESLHDIETTKRVLLEVKKEEEEAEMKTDAEPLIKTVVEEANIVNNEETTAHVSKRLKENEELVEAIKNSSEVTVDKEKEEVITQNTEEVQESVRVTETPTIQGEDKSKASLDHEEETDKISKDSEEHEHVLVRDIGQGETLVTEADTVDTSTVQEAEILKTNINETEAQSAIGEEEEGQETKENTKPNQDLKEDKEQEETEMVKTIISSDEVRSFDVQVEEFSEHIEPHSLEIKDESHGREESVEVKSKDTVQEESTEEKHENILDVPSTESVKYQDNEPETSIVSNSEKFEDIPSDLALNVDKEELKDQVDGTQIMEEQRGLNSNGAEAEQIDRNRTDETEKSPVSKLVVLPDVESVENMQKPSLESPSEVSEETSKNIDEKIEEKPEEETVTVSESKELGEQAHEERTLIDLTPLQEESCQSNEKEKETKLETHEPTNEEAKSDEVIEVSSASPSKEMVGEIVIEAEKIEIIKENEEEQAADKILKSLETVEKSHSSFPSSLVEKEHGTVSGKVEDEKVKEEEPMVQIKSEKDTTKSQEKQEESSKTGETTVVQAEQTRDIGPSLTEKCSIDQTEPEEQVKEACSRDEQEKEVSRNNVNETYALQSAEATEEETATNGESPLHDVESTKRVLLEVEKEAEEAEMKTEEIETVETVVEDAKIVNNEETTAHESESLKGDTHEEENADPVETIKNADDAEQISREVIVNRETEEDMTQKTEKVRSCDVQVEEFSEHIETHSLEIKDESHEREESVEVKSKETVQEESTEDKHENIHDVASTESVKSQDNEPETALVANTESQEKFEETPSDLTINVDKEDLKDDKINVDQVDGTQIMEEQRGLDPDEPKAEKIDQNRTDEIEEIPVKKLVAFPDVESIKQIQKPSLESPSEVSEETIKTVDEKIEEKPEEEVTLHPEGQVEGSYGLETKEETVSVPESIELREKSQKERSVVDIIPLQEESSQPNEQEKETKLEKHEPTNEEVKSDEFIAVSSASPSKELKGETVIEAEKIENIKEYEEEQAADKIQKSVETVESHTSLPSSLEEKEHETVSEKMEDEKVKDEEPMVQIKSEDDTTKIHERHEDFSKAVETNETTVVQVEQTRDIEPSLTEKCSMDQSQPEEQVKEACSRDEQEKEVSKNSENNENIVNETYALHSEEAAEEETATNGESPLHDVETTKRVLLEVEKEAEEAEMKTDAEPSLDAIEKEEIETVKTVVEDAKIINNEETTAHESDSLKGDDHHDENAESVETTKNSDNAEQISREVTVDKETEEDTTQKTEKVQESSMVIETSTTQGEEIETQASLEHKEEVDQSSKDIEEHEHVLGRDLPQCETLEVEAVEAKEDTKPSLDKEDKEQEVTETAKTVIFSDEVRPSDQVDVQAEEFGEHTETCSSEIKDESHGREESVEVKTKETVQEENTEEKHENLLDVPSTESEKYQDNEPHIADLALSVDKEKLNDEKINVDKVDGTKIIEENRGLDSNGAEAEQVDQNRTNETEESPVVKLVVLPDVESVEQIQKPSLESPSKVSEETSKTVEEKIEEKSEEETVSVQESKELGEQANEERTMIDLTPLQEESSQPNEQENETMLEKHEPTNEQVSSESFKGDDNKGENAESVEAIKNSDDAEQILSEVIRDREKEEVQEIPRIIETPREDIESKASLELKEEEDQSSKDIEEHGNVLGRDIPQCEILETDAVDTSTTIQEAAVLKTLETNINETEAVHRAVGMAEEGQEIKEDTDTNLDMKHDKEQKEAEILKTVIFSDEVRSSDQVDVQAEELGEDTKPFISEIKDESQGREELVEVKSKETVQDESSEEKNVNLLDKRSGESEMFQENEPETTLVSKTESQEKSEEIRSDLALKDELKDEKTKADQVDETQTMEVQRGLDLNEPEAEQTDQNITDESPAEKLAVEGAGLDETPHNQTFLDVESVEKVQKPSLETPSDILEETSKTIDEKIDDKPKEEVTLDQEGQEEGSYGLETEEETVSVSEEPCMPNEQENETKLQEKNELTKEEVSNDQQSPAEETSDEVIQVSSASTSEERECETVVEAEKIGDESVDEEEQVAEKIQKILETVETVESHSPLQEHATVSEKIDDEKVEDVEPMGDMSEKGLEITETTDVSLPSVDQKKDMKAFDEEIQIPSVAIPLYEQEKVTSTEKEETKANETAEAKKEDEEITMSTSKTSENVCIQQEEFGKLEVPKLEESKEDKSLEIAESIKAIEATSDQTLPIETSSDADNTLSSELVSEEKDQTTKLVEEIHKEETEEAHKLQAEEIFPIEITPRESSDEVLVSILASKKDDQVTLQEDNCANDVRETNDTQEERSVSVETEEVVGETKPNIPEDDVETPTSPIILEKNDNEITEAKKGDEDINETALDTPGTSATSENVCIKQEEFGNQEAPKLEESKEEKSQNISETTEAKEATGDQTLPIETSQEDQTLASELVSRVDDQTPRHVEEIHEEETKEERKFEAIVDQSLPVETSQEYQTPSSDLASELDDQTSKQVDEEETKEEHKLQVEVDQILPVETSQEDQTPSLVEEILEEETKETHKVQAEGTIPRESFSEAPVSVLASGEDEPVTPQESNYAGDDTQEERLVFAEIEEKVVETKPKEPEAERTEKPDNQVETSTKLTEVEDENTKKMDIEVAELTDYSTGEAEHEDENSSTLPVVEILKGLHQLPLETERELNDSISSGENVKIEPADQQQKTGDAEVESNEKDSASDIIEELNLQEEDKEEVKVQDVISREFEVNVEDKLQEEILEIAECKEEVPADLSLTEVLPVVKILIPSSALPSEEVEHVTSAENQEECEPQQDVNASISENISRQEEQKEKKAETHETVKEEYQIVDNKEEKKSEEEQDEKLWDSAATRDIKEIFSSEVKDDKEVHRVLGSEEEINEVVISEKQITDPVGVITKAREAEHEPNEEHIETQVILDDRKSNDDKDFPTAQAPKDQEEVSSDKSLTKEALVEQIQVTSSALQDDQDLSVQKQSELIQPHQSPNQVEETSFEAKKAEENKNEETGDAVIINKNVQVQDQSKDFEASVTDKETSEQEQKSKDIKDVQEDIGTNVKLEVHDDEVRCDSHDSVVEPKEETGLIEEKKEVEHVKTELEDAIKHGVLVEEKNNTSEKIEHEAAKEISQEESKQTYAVKEEIREEEESNQECLTNVKKTDDAIDLTQTETREIESLSSVSKTQDKPEQKDEVSNQQTREIADAVPKIAEEVQQKDGESKNTKDLFSEVKESEPTEKESARKSLSDLSQKVKGTTKTEDTTTEPHIEEKLKTEEEENEDEDHEHNKDDKTSPDSIVMVEAKDTVSIIKTHKKSQGILSGVGSKVKHSISKVKKALTGKSSHTTKPSSPK